MTQVLPLAMLRVWLPLTVAIAGGITPLVASDRGDLLYRPAQRVHGQTNAREPQPAPPHWISPLPVEHIYWCQPLPGFLLPTWSVNFTFFTDVQYRRISLL